MLELVKKGLEKKPRRTVIYGTNGVGKSTFGAGSTNPIFIRTEDGIGDIDVSTLELCTEYSQVLEQIGALINEKHEFKTVVLDSLDWLEKLIWVHTAKEHGKANIESIGYAKGYIYALDHFRQVLRGLDILREKGIGVILIAHSKIEKYEDPNGEGYDRFNLSLHKQASALVREWADEILFAAYQVFTKQSESTDKVKAIGTGQRLLYTLEKPSCIAKNRLGMPAEIPLSFAEYAKYFKN